MLHGIWSADVSSCEAGGGHYDGWSSSEWGSELAEDVLQPVPVSSRQPPSLRKLLQFVMRKGRTKEEQQQDIAHIVSESLQVY